MASGDGNVSDPYLAVVASSNFDEVSVVHIYDMDNLNALLGDTLEHNVLVLRPIKGDQVYVATAL